MNRFASQAGPARLLVKATSRESKLDPFKAYINQRWNEGITSAAALHAELAATQGRTGSVQAVTAGLALPCNSGTMEGNVNKIKMIKRQMFGRAGFALLRKRVLLHPG